MLESDTSIIQARDTEQVAAGNTVQKYIEALVETEVNLGVIEAATEIFVDQIIKESVESEEGDEKHRTKDFSHYFDHENSDNKSLFQKVKCLVRVSDSFVTRYMWVIAFVWLLAITLRWIGSEKSSARPQKAKPIFRSSGAQLLTRPPPPPTPFFPNYSRALIDDHYSGNHAKPGDLHRKSEIAILMFYAPWSLHAQEARKPFIDVAAAFAFMPTVRFSAVNCFTKYGECKRSYKLYSYPLFLAYVKNVHVGFTGLPTTAGLFRFVKHIIDPADKVTSLTEVNQAMEEYQFLIAGYFPFEGSYSEAEYSTFVAAAMKSAGHPNIFESARFIVIQNPTLAHELTLDRHNKVKLLTRRQTESGQGKWTASAAFPWTKHTKSDDIIEWTKEKIVHTDRAIVEWLYLDIMEAGGKSETLYSALNDSNAAILFTRDYANEAQSSSLKVVKEAARAYLSCNETSTIAQGPVDVDKIEEAQRSCRHMALNLDQVVECCKGLQSQGLCREASSIDLHDDSCNAVLKVMPYEILQSKCCRARRSPTKIKALFSTTWKDQLECEWYRLMKKSEALPSAPQHQEADHVPFDAIKGLGCQSNETLKFYAAGRKHSDHLLQKLNLVNDSRSWDDRLVIVSLDRESLHAIDGDLNSSSVAKFLVDFHQNHLQHVQMNEEFDEQVPGKKLQTFQKLNNHKFTEFLASKRTHDSVVFFTGGLTHGPSASISYILHTVASYFSDFNHLIRFYIVDASANDLPYQYTFDRLPALVFFPPRHLSTGGARYPHHLPVSVPNLLAFLLSRSQPELRWRVALSSCSQDCLQRNRLQLHHFIRLLDASTRKLRSSRSHQIRHGLGHDVAAIQAVYTRTTLHRRALQRTAAIHLDNILQLLATKNNNIKNLPIEDTNRIVKESLFVRWILYNHFGL